MPKEKEEYINMLECLWCEAAAAAVVVVKHQKHLSIYIEKNLIYLKRGTFLLCFSCRRRHTKDGTGMRICYSAVFLLFKQERALDF